jgi:hypothetical protein
MDLNKIYIYVTYQLLLYEYDEPLVSSIWTSNITWRRESIILLEDSQAPPARRSNKSTMKAKKLERLDAVAWDRGRGGLISWINAELHNLETAMGLNFGEFKSGGLH